MQFLLCSSPLARHLWDVNSNSSKQLSSQVNLVKSKAKLVVTVRLYLGLSRICCLDVCALMTKILEGVKIWKQREVERLH